MSNGRSRPCSLNRCLGGSVPNGTEARQSASRPGALDSEGRSGRASAPAVQDCIGSSELYNQDDSDYKVVSHGRRSRLDALKPKSPSMNIPPVGIDISQLSFDAALRLDAERSLTQQFRNGPTGFRRFARWLKTHGVGRIRLAVEATSTFAEALLEWAYHQGHEVFLLNAEHVAHYARSLGRRNKTDRVDATTIAAFITTHRVTPWRPPSPEQKTLRSLTRTRAQLVETRLHLSNQLSTAADAGAAHLRVVLHHVKTQLAAIEREIRAHVRAHPVLHEQVERLTTMKGVGPLTAAVLVAELPPITADTDPRTIAAWAGLTPCRRQSGRTEWRARLSRKGNSFVRAALFMPALVAKRYNPVLSSFAKRLAEKGKTHGAILGAIAHKMLRILVGLLRSNTNFDPNWSYQK